MSRVGEREWEGKKREKGQAGENAREGKECLRQERRRWKLPCPTSLLIVYLYIIYI